MTTLFGLTGPAGCGKDTIAERLMAMHGFVPTAFADPLRSAASEAFGVDYNDFIDREKKDAVNAYWGMSPRQMLQKTGTEAMRGTFGPEFWIRRWALTYNEIRDVASCVVSDVRFENEAEMVRDCGGTVIHIWRPGVGDLEGDHASGRGIQFYEGDIVLGNDRDIKALFEKVDALVKEIG